MKRNVQLYIAGRRVDLGDDSWILFNWTREDLANPTAVVNSSSHQVTLPGTARNNSVLGSVFRCDRRTVFGESYAGTQFDPTRKTPFALYADDGAVLESGYCRLDSVQTHRFAHSYTLTLYGGIGSFFYQLASKDDGTPRTLADLIYKDVNGDDETAFDITPHPATVRAAWKYLDDGSTDYRYFWNILNFCPAYNGLPDDFDASHAIMNHDAYFNMPLTVEADEVTYRPRTGADGALVNFSSPHTEWEMGDLRWYLQRPCISVKAFIAAICDTRNNGGYTVTLDPSFFDDSNPYYGEGWWTLNMIASEDRASGACLKNVLASSKSPMEYLVSFAKVFGLLFLWDSGERSVRIVTRATFYAEQADKVIDLSKRLDRSQEIAQTPVLADSKWYQLGDGGKGEFVEQYAQAYGRGYGVQRINTGYEFDAGTKILTEGLAFQDAAEVLEANQLFSEASKVASGRYWNRYFQLPKYEPITFELWNDEDESRTFDMQCEVPVIYYDNPDHPGADWLPKLQLHGADNKSQDGSDVLVLFAGTVAAPVFSSGSWAVGKRLYLTADTDTMTLLNGAPCWNLVQADGSLEALFLSSLPSFRRVAFSGAYISASLEWGIPLVRAVPDLTYPIGSDVSVYGLWWKGYLADRYNADTRVLKAMVDLRGLQVGQALLRRFYWLDGALWTLNAIRNHSFTSWDLTECEFVKVQDKAAYTSGPSVLDGTYLTISPASSSFSVSGSGGSQALTVRSSSAWTATLSSVVDWLTLSTASGSAGTSSLGFTATANNSSARRAVTVTLQNEDGETVSFTVVQVPKAEQSISLSPSSITIEATGTTGRGRSCSVDASSAWAVDSTTVPEWLTVTAGQEAINIKAGANSGAARDASVKVYLTADSTKYATIAVHQEAGAGGTGGITLLDGNGNGSATAPAAGQTLRLYVTVPDNANWTLVNGTSFATLSAASGTGNGYVDVTIPANSGSAREGTITAKREGYNDGAVFYLHQAAQSAPTGNIEIVDNAYEYDNYIDVDNYATTYGAVVKASGAWTAQTSSAWIHPNTYGGSFPWSGSGNATIWFDVDANPGAARSGIITATLTGTSISATFRVNQSGDGTVTITATFNRNSITSAAQTVVLSINAPAGVGWTIGSVSSGLTPSTYSGTGPQDINVSVAANSGSARTLSLTVSSSAYGVSDTASLTQAAPAASTYLRVTPFGTVNVGANITSVSFSVESNTSWSVASSAQGVTFSQSSGNGNATVTATFPANTGSSSKSIPITFTTTSGTTITQSATIVQAGVSSDSIYVSDNLLTFGPAAGSQNIDLSSSGNWTASKSASWISVSPASGSSGYGQQVAISVTQNGSGAHSGTVTFTCGSASVTVTVSQSAAEYLNVGFNAVSLLPASGSSMAVNVYASSAWAISANTPPPSWLGLSYPSHAGNDNGEPLTFTAQTENTTGADRSSTIRVVLSSDSSVYQDITVTQAWNSTLYLSPSYAEVGQGLGSGYIDVTSNTSWEITSISEGLNIDVDEQSGTGNLRVDYTYDGNPGNDPRTLTAVFETTDGRRTATFTLVQAAAPLVAITVTPQVVNLAGTGQSVLLNVVASSNWTAVASDPWISVSPASGAAGSFSVYVAAGQNNGAPRSGSVTFTCNGMIRTIPVSQASGADLAVSANAVQLGSASGATADILVYASGEWRISEDSEIIPWLSVTYQTHAGSPTGEALTFTAQSENSTGATRTGTVRLELANNYLVYVDIAVSQSSTPVLSTNPSADNAPKTAGTGYFTLNCNTSWRLTSIDDGLYIGSAGQNGTGTKSIGYSYTANPTAAERVLRAYFATLDGSKTAMFTLHQAAGDPPIRFTPDTALTFDEDHTTRQVVVRCTSAWTAQSSKSWLRFIPSSGAANTDVTVTFTPILSLSQRQSAVWTVTAGDNTKQLLANSEPSLNA